MLKKSIPVILILAAVCLLFLAAHNVTSQGTESQISIDQLKQQAIDNIRKNKEVDANATIQVILADYSNDEKLSSVLYSIAEAYRNNSKFAKSIELYKYIVENQTASRQAALAQSGLAISNVAIGKLEAAKMELEKLKSNYAAEPNIAQLVFNVGDSFYWFGHFRDCNDIYAQVIKIYPGSDYAMWATMGLAISCIASKDQNSADVYIKKLSTDYTKNGRLPEALFYVAGRFGYGRNYEKANEIYNKISNNWPEDKWAKDSSYESSKLVVFSYLDKKDESNTLKAVEKLISDFNRPDLQAVVYDIAARTDSLNKHEPNKFTEILLNKVINLSPRSIFAKRAIVNIMRNEIDGIIKSDGDANDIIAGVETIAKDYKNLPEAAEDLMTIASKLSGKGWEGRDTKDEAKAVRNWQLDVHVRQKLIENFPNSPILSQAYYTTGLVLAQNLSEYEKGIEYFKTVIEKWPDFERAWRAQMNIGRFLERLKFEKKINEMQFELQIINSYKAVFEKYPDCEASDYSILKAANLHYGIGQFNEAIVYFEKYLSKRPDDLKEVVGNYGNSLERTGQKEKAILIYRDFLKVVDSNNPVKNFIKTRLERLEGGAR